MHGRYVRNENETNIMIHRKRLQLINDIIDIAIGYMDYVPKI